MDIIQLIIALIGTAGGSYWISAWATRKKLNAEAERILGEAYGALVKDLRSEVDRLTERVSNQEKRELKYLEIIAQKDNTELQLRIRIKELENEILILKKFNSSNEATHEV